MNDTFITEMASGEDTLSGRYLTFQIGKELFGIEIRYVREIVGIQEIIEMPEMPDYIKGIINLRGKIIPLMCVRARFGKEQQAYDDRTCVVVVDFSGVMIGLIVDSVSEVLTLSNEEIVEVPQTGMGVNSRYVEKIGKLGSNVVMLINIEKLLTAVELEELELAE